VATGRRRRYHGEVLARRAPRRLRGAILSLLAAGASLPGCGTPRLTRLSPTDLARLLERELERNDAAGVVVAAAWADGRQVVRSAGWARRSPPTAATSETRWPWFSVTKLFTATAILQLAEAGRLRLDEPAATYVPSFAPRGHRPPTIRELLAHTSGLANPIPVTWIHLAGEPGPSLDELTARLLAAHPDLESEPGTRFRYSNLGYLVLGQVVERVSGEPFEAYVHRHLLEPLQLTGSSFSVTPATAAGYSARWSLMGLAAWWMLDARFFGPTERGLTELRPFSVDGAPYGGLVGPASDLARLGQAMLGGGQLDGRRLLSRELTALALTPSRTTAGAVLPVGLGWHLGEVGGEPFAHHIGGGGGFRSELRIYPRLGYAIAVIANETSFDTDVLARVIVEPPVQRLEGP